jgi:hypothetical protein
MKHSRFPLKHSPSPSKHSRFPSNIAAFAPPTQTRLSSQPINAAVAGYATAIWHAAITAVMADT